MYQPPPFTTTQYREVLRKDPCCYCGGKGGTIDHIEAVGLLYSRLTPKQKGTLINNKPLPGWQPSRWDNLTGACRHCNNHKQTKTLLQHLLGIQHMIRDDTIKYSKWLRRRAIGRRSCEAAENIQQNREF